MTSIAQVGSAMQKVLTEVAARAGKKSGFVQRQSKMGGAEFAQTLTFGWMSNPQATLEELAQTAGSVGVAISAQGLDQRFSKSGASCLKMILDEAINQVIQGQMPAVPILKRFSAVYLQDSTIIELPAQLAEEWQGCGNGRGTGQAALKVEIRLDLLQGEMVGPLLEDGRIHDAVSQIQSVAVLPNSLRIADLGYWRLETINQIDQAGGYWLSRLKNTLTITTAEGKTWDILDFLQTVPEGQPVDCPVQVSLQSPTPARLLAIRVPQAVADQRRRKLRAQAKRRQQPLSHKTLALADWTILVTNVPLSLLTLPEALILLRVRWQIELLFKLWKSHGYVDEWRSTKPWRILCEVYAKLLGLLIQHWIFLVSFWQFANRSLVKASQTIRKHALLLACALPTLDTLSSAITVIQRCLQFGCRINKRKKDLRSFQLLLSLSLEP